MQVMDVNGRQTPETNIEGQNLSIQRSEKKKAFRDDISVRNLSCKELPQGSVGVLVSLTAEQRYWSENPGPLQRANETNESGSQRRSAFLSLPFLCSYSPADREKPVARDLKRKPGGGLSRVRALVLPQWQELVRKHRLFE